LGSLTGIVREIHARMMKWEGHVSRVGQERKVLDVERFVDLGVNGTTISEWI
jgi:hypothetical protein